MHCSRCGNAYSSDDASCLGCGTPKTADTVMLRGTVRQMLGREPVGADAWTGRRFEISRCSRCGRGFEPCLPSCPGCGGPKTADAVCRDLAFPPDHAPSDEEWVAERIRNQFRWQTKEWRTDGMSRAEYLKVTVVGAACLAFPALILLLPVAWLVWRRVRD